MTGGGLVVSIDIANNLFSIVLTVLIILGIFISFIAWFIRLESKVNYLEKDQLDHKAEIANSQALFRKESQARDRDIWEKMEVFQVGMNKLLAAVSKIEGKLDNSQYRP